MATRNTADQIAFRYRPTDSATGVSRDTAKRLAQRLGVDETQAIHLALHNMAVRSAAAVRGGCGSADGGSTAADQKARSARQEALGPDQPVRCEVRVILQWWAEPTAGEIVWCHFPDDINPRPKPRPALILAVFDDDAPQFTVRVAYGTSQRTTTLHRGEFAILRDRNPAAYEAAGLSYDTKFDLRQTLDLPYTTEWFTVPPAAPHGQTPKLGTLHPSLVRAVQAAFRASKSI